MRRIYFSFRWILFVFLFSVGLFAGCATSPYTGHQENKSYPGTDQMSLAEATLMAAWAAEEMGFQIKIQDTNTGYVHAVQERPKTFLVTIGSGGMKKYLNELEIWVGTESQGRRDFTVKAKICAYDALQGRKDEDIVPQFYATLDAMGKLAYLGVSVRDVTPELGNSLNLGEAKGALLHQVWKKGPADDAGLRVGDVILEVAGKPILGVDDLKNTIRMQSPGTRVVVKVWRNGNPVYKTVSLGQNAAFLTDSTTTPAAPFPAEWEPKGFETGQE